MRGAARLLAGVVLAAVAGAASVYFFCPGVMLSLAERLELRAAGLHRMAAQVGTDHVVYLDGGAGPVLLLLHGFGADKSNWVRVARYLTPHFRVIAPDLPGFGESTRDPNAHYAVADQVERVHAFALALGLGKVHLGGNSMGGGASLWLIAPGFVRSAKRSELDERIARKENPLFVDDAEGFDRLIDFVFVERPAIPGPILRYLTAQAIEHRPFNEKVMHDLFTAPIALEDVEKGLPMPTLISWGDHDRLVDVSGAQILGSVIPGSTVNVIPNVGHAAMVERPQQTADAFLSFRGIH